jgi:hypothetical protein
MRSHELVGSMLGAMALLAATACDPSLFYRVPGWREVAGDGIRYEGEVHPGVKARVHSTGFGGSLGVRLEVINVSLPNLTFDGTAMNLVAPTGRPLPSDTLNDQHCQQSVGVPATLGAGEAITISCGWSARLSGVLGLTLNSDLDEVILVQKGFASPNAPVRIAINMRRL